MATQVEEQVNRSLATGSQDNLSLGAALLTAGFLANTLQGAFGKVAQETISAAQFIWLTLCIALLLLLPVVLWRGAATLKTQVFRYYVLRGLFGLGGFYLFVLGANLGSLVNANVLLNTTPIFIPILALLFLGKQVSNGLWGAIALGFIGLAMVLQPTAALLQEPGNLIALGAGLSAAVEFLTVRWLNKTESPLAQVTYYLLIGNVLAAPLALWQWQTPDLRTWGFILATAVAFLAFQFLLVRAYQYAEPHQIGVFQYSSVIFSALIGWVWFNEVPNALAVAGMVLVSVGGAIALYLEQKPKAEPDSSSQPS
ncbi:MAG: DMT family transporter [Leptolyngbya sp. SIO4C1]|nr:DMT family transporter [Leptolyngbya sp. SIO4C1]